MGRRSIDSSGSSLNDILVLELAAKKNEQWLMASIPLLPMVLSGNVVRVDVDC